MDPMERLRQLEEENARLRAVAENDRARSNGITEEEAAEEKRRVFRRHLLKLMGPLLEDLTTLDTANVEALSEAMIRDARRERASDIHLEPESGGVRVRMRIDGALHDATRLTHPQAKRIIRHFMTMADLDPVALFRPEESRRSIPIGGGEEIDVRLTFAPCVTGEKMNIRLLDATRVETNLHALGLREDHLAGLKEWLNNAGGMFLVAGPTGSGKTTTLYSILNELKQQERSIVTIEDPVEFQIDGLTQMQVREDRGLSFSNGIKAMLRLDPDYIMVGEIRDRDSARAAAEAAASGRVILSTLHSRDAVGAISSLRSWGLNDHEITATVSVVVAQRLVRTLSEKGKVLEAPTDVERAWLDSLGLPVPEKTWHSVPAGDNDGLGYHGRTGIFEVWHIGDRDYEMILSHADERSIRRRLYQTEHISLVSDGLEKVRSGMTTLDELRAKLGIDPRSAQGQPQGAEHREPVGV